MTSLGKKLSFVIILVVVLFAVSKSVHAEGEDFWIYGGSTSWGCRLALPVFDRI